MSSAGRMTSKSQRPITAAKGMSPKTGRPLSENPKNITVQVRMDEKTIEKLDSCADKLKTSRSEVIRIGIDKVDADIKK